MVLIKACGFKFWKVKADHFDWRIQKLHLSWKLRQAATAGDDDYTLTHKGSFTNGRPDNSHVTLGSKFTSSKQVKVTEKNNETTKSGPVCNYC